MTGNNNYMEMTKGTPKTIGTIQLMEWHDVEGKESLELVIKDERGNTVKNVLLYVDGKPSTNLESAEIRAKGKGTHPLNYLLGDTVGFLGFPKIIEEIFKK